MSKYFDLAVVRVIASAIVHPDYIDNHRNTICVAPAFSLEAGDEVVFDDGAIGTVLQSTTTSEDSHDYSVILAFAGIEKPERLAGKKTLTTFTYDDAAPEES